MIAKIGSQIRITKPNKELLDWCHKELILKNPDYVKKLRMNKWVGNTPDKICLYEWDGDTLVLPYGCMTKVAEFADRRDVVEYDMKKPKLVWYNANVPLYDYQQTAVKEAAAAYHGIIQAPAGSGKTQMGIALAILLGRRTLWLTHTADLLNQSKERAEQYMDPDLIGTITEGKVNIGKGITFATVQTMSRLYLPQYRDKWDVIITDECHRVASSPTSVSMFGKVLNTLSARHKYGLSATVHRADGLIKSTFALIGPVCHTVADEAVIGKIMSVTVCPVSTGIAPTTEVLDTDGTIVYAKLISHLAACEDRNRLIGEKLVENASHSNLILSDRLEHLRTLMEMLPSELREQAVMIDGKMQSKKAKEQRQIALQQMRRGQKRFLFATYSLCKEGLDIPRLDRLYLTTPQKDYAVITQSLGRIARVFEGKGEPIAYDFVDEKFQYLLRAYKKRCTTYRKLKCKFI